MLVEREVRRADHRDRGGPAFGGMRGQRDRVAGRLGAAVGCDLEPAGGGPDEELERPAALVGATQDSLSGRPERQDPVQAARREKVDVGAERGLIERLAVVAKRRHGGGKRTSEHAPTLSSPP